MAKWIVWNKKKNRQEFEEIFSSKRNAEIAIIQTIVGSQLGKDASYNRSIYYLNNFSVRRK